MVGNSKLHTTSPARRHIFVILAVSLLVRLFYHLAYRPWWCGDSGGYTGPFWMWRHGYFSDGARMPLYPLFLGTVAVLTHSRPVGYNTMSTRAAFTAVTLQSALGICAAVLIYDTMRKLGIRGRLAFCGAICFALIAALSQFEMLLLTESLATFSLIFSLWLFARVMNKLQRGENAVPAAIWAGVGFSIAVLVRTEMLVFFVVLLTCMALVFALSVIRSRRQTEAAGNGRPAFSQSLRHAPWLMPLAAAPCILGWMSVNYVGTGQFRLTTMMGYQLNQSVYNLYDRVDPEDRLLGQIMVKYYHETNQGGQIKRDYLWSALDEVRAHVNEMPIHWKKHIVYHPDVFKMGDFAGFSIDLGDYMGGVAMKLVKRNPYAWLRNGADTFVHDTFNFEYGQPPRFAQITASTDPRSVDMKDVIRYPALSRIAAWANHLQAPILSALYVFTLVVALFGPILLLRNPRSTVLLMDGVVVAIALSTVMTFISFCLLAAYYPQYGSPFLGCMLVVFVYAVDRLMSVREAKR